MTNISTLLICVMHSVIPLLKKGGGGLKILGHVIYVGVGLDKRIMRGLREKGVVK